MIRCKRCGHEFDDYDFKVSHEDCGDFAVCPACGGDDWTHIYQCKICGKWVEETTYDACESCLQEITQQLHDIQMGMTQEQFDVFAMAVCDL